jgi:hypothetical protein
MNINEKKIPANALKINFNLKSSISFLLFKRLIIAYISIFFFTALNAKEPTLAILKNVYTNNIQKFSISQYNYICKAYGIVSIDDLYSKSIQNDICKKSIEDFYSKNYTKMFYTQHILHLEQMYHIEFRDKECILHAQGEKTLSEILLYEGLAIKKINFRDEIYKERFINAQDNARKSRRGLWKTTLYKNCFPELNRN